MNYTVVFDEASERDLAEIYDYLLSEAGERTADRYTGQIIDYCKSLEIFPKRGTSRDEIAPGLRQVGYRRRATIIFRVKDTEIVILRVFNHGRNIGLSQQDDE